MNVLRLKETVFINKVDFPEKLCFFKLDSKLIESCIKRTKSSLEIRERVLD